MTGDLCLAMHGVLLALLGIVIAQLRLFDRDRERRRARRRRQ